MLSRFLAVFVSNLLLLELVNSQRMQRLNSPQLKYFTKNAINNTNELKEAKINLAEKISTLLDTVHSSKTFVKNPLLK